MAISALYAHRDAAFPRGENWECHRAMSCALPHNEFWKPLDQFGDWTEMKEVGPESLSRDYVVAVEHDVVMDGC